MQVETGTDFVSEREASSMGLPYVTSFLWCLSLKTGTKLISLLHFCAGTASLILCSLLAVEARRHIGAEGAPDAERVYARAHGAAAAVAAGSALHVVLACVLVYGVFARKASVLRAWVLVMVVLFVAAISFVVVSAALFGLNSTGSDIFLAFLEGIVVFAFIGYCILCVYSYYLMLRSSEDMEGPNKTDR